MDFGLPTAWDDMELLTSPSRGGPHRRVRSDPSDIMQALRAERAQWGGSAPMPSALAKRELSPMESSGFSPAYKRPAPSLPDAPAAPFQPSLFGAGSGGALHAELTQARPCDEDDDDEPAGKCSKKDVPMWTVEEDLLILQLVEKHGKRWSKIAQQLPGRTDNGVRNRWNRMERAQVLRQRRGPEAGYRCRRCGQPKRGHICAALTLGETPAGDELTQKAQALSKLSADRMRPPSAASEMSTLAPSEPAVSPQNTPQLGYARAPSPPDMLPLNAVAVRDHQKLCVPVAPAAAMGAMALAKREPVAVAAPVASASLEAPAPPSAERQPSVQFDEAQLDDFLEELQLHELTTTGKAEQASLNAVAASLTGEQQQPAVQHSSAGSASSALLSQASLQQLLMSLAGPENGFVASGPSPSQLAAF